MDENKFNSRIPFFGNSKTLLSQSRAVFYIAAGLHLLGWFTYALETWVLLIYIPSVLLAAMALWAILSREFRIKPTSTGLKLACVLVSAYVVIVAAVTLYQLKDGFPVIDRYDSCYYVQLGTRKTAQIDAARYEFLKHAAYLFTTAFAPLIALVPLCYFRQCRPITWENNYVEHRHHHHHHHHHNAE